MTSNNHAIYLMAAALSIILYSSHADSKEWSVQSDVSTRIEHNDNVFLTSEEKQSSTSLFVTPKSNIKVSEQNWNAGLDASFRSNNYDDSELNSNDIILGANGSYLMERNLFSLTSRYVRDSNLSSASSSFGLADARVKSESAVYSPGYTRLFTRRLRGNVAYTHSSITYSDVGTTGFVPSSSNIISASLTYDATELHNLSLTVSNTAFENSDRSTEYDLQALRLGLESNLTETLSSKIVFGRSRNDLILRNTTDPINFFGTIITRDTESELTNENSLYDLSISKKYETWSLTGKISKDNSTDSFGNLNEVDLISLRLDHSISNLVSYAIDIHYDEVRAVTDSTAFTDRDTLFAGASLHYTLNKNWILNANYQYSKREFKEQATGDRPYSNIISLSLVYKFPVISTF